MIRRQAQNPLNKKQARISRKQTGLCEPVAFSKFILLFYFIVQLFHHSVGQRTDAGHAALLGQAGSVVAQGQLRAGRHYGHVVLLPQFFNQPARQRCKTKVLDALLLDWGGQQLVIKWKRDISENEVNIVFNIADWRVYYEQDF